MKSGRLPIEGFDGVMLGAEGAPYHFEFTRNARHIAGRAPSKDHLLIFYYPDPNTWQRAVDQLKENGFEPVPAFNPYWEKSGLTFEDPDGYRVVITVVFPFATDTSICRSRFTTCSALCFSPLGISNSLQPVSITQTGTKRAGQPSPHRLNRQLIS